MGPKCNHKYSYKRETEGDWIQMGEEEGVCTEEKVVCPQRQRLE